MVCLFGAGGREEAPAARLASMVVVRGARPPCAAGGAVAFASAVVGITAGAVAVGRRTVGRRFAGGGRARALLYAPLGGRDYTVCALGRVVIELAQELACGVAAELKASIRSSL